jgi:hypothetical protein
LQRSIATVTRTPLMPPTSNIYAELSDALHPGRFTRMSPRLQAVVAYVLNERWTAPEITALHCRADGLVVAATGCNRNFDTLIGSHKLLTASWARLLDTAKISPRLRREADRIFATKVKGPPSNGA